MLLCQSDCITAMAAMLDNSIDMVFADLPYGTTVAKWDQIIPADLLWEQYSRIIRPDGAIVLTASQPFTSALVCSKPEWFRCEWIWDKVNAANFANAKRQPLKQHESVLIFSQKPTRYFPIKTPGRPNHVQGANAKPNRSETRLIEKRVDDDLSGLKYPKSIQTFSKHSSQVGLHPTQKPVALMEYFIQTYSLPGETVLDNCMGSGSTGIACLNTGREFVGIEKDPSYFALAKDRLEKHAANRQRDDLLGVA